MTKPTTRKALIIDDEKEIGMLLGYQLKRLNVENQYAPTLTEGFKLFSETNYDILFLDINLPDGNGLDAIHNLLQQNSSTSIVVMSAYNTKEYNEKALKLGACSFIGKPFDSSTIKNIISECCQNKPQN